ncbi:MAG: hypothetical protein ACFE8C_05845 [Promethearchaeota archaeon]
MLFNYCYCCWNFSISWWLENLASGRCRYDGGIEMEKGDKRLISIND